MNKTMDELTAENARLREVIEAAQAQTGGTSMRLRMALKTFRRNWPGLMKGKVEDRKESHD